VSQAERFETLWTDFLEGELDGSGREELGRMLESDASLLRQAADAYQVHRLLGLALQPEEAGAFVRATMGRLPKDRESFVTGLMDRLRGGTGAPETRHGTGFRRILPFAVTAGAAACLTLAAIHFSGIAPTKPTPPQPAPSAVDAPAYACVATLVFADQCRWEADGPVPIEGQRLAPGRIRLADGLAIVRFDGGAAAAFSGGTELEIESRVAARLARGRVTVRAAGDASGFAVRTPAAEMVDLGTEFAVVVEPDGATELHVLEGEVEIRKRNAPRDVRLYKAGKAVRYDRPDAAKPRPVALNARRFDQLFRDARPGPREDLLYAYEGFNYGTGNMTTAAANGGFGWAGPWRQRNGIEISPRDADETSGEMAIAYQKLSVPWPVQGGRAGMLETPPGKTYRIRPMQHALDLGRDAVYYVSLMVRESARQPGDDAGPDESARLTFRSSTAYWGDSVCLGLPGNLKPHIDLKGLGRFVAPTPVAADQSLLWVGKIVARRRGEDEVYFRVYQEGDPLDLVEPAQWDVASHCLDSDARLDLLLLTSTGRAARWFDELRVGTSWRAVVPLLKPTDRLFRQSK
jgi:hypothetical protein